MKHFLFISDWINPFEPHFGGAQRSNLLLRAFLRFGEVDLIAFTDGIESNIEGCTVVYSKKILTSPNISRVKKWTGLLASWNPYSIFPVNNEKERIVDGFVAKNHYDAIVVRYVPEAMSMGLMKYANRLIVDVDDHPRDALKNRACQVKSKPNKLYYYLASFLAPIAIKHIANVVKTAFFPDPQQVVGKNGRFLPNISFNEPVTEYVDFRKTKPRLFFVGKLDYLPNYKGVDWFVDHVWCLVKETVPDAELHIAGKVDKSLEYIVEPFLKKWKTVDGVYVLGFVDDINKEYAECRATISPIFSGAGTNIKLIESIQRKRVCVTTTCGMRGMESFLKRGVSILATDHVDNYAKLCVKLLIDEGYNREIAEHASSIIEHHFSQQSFNGIVEEILNK